MSEFNATESEKLLFCSFFKFIGRVIRCDDEVDSRWMSEWVSECINLTKKIFADEGFVHDEKFVDWVIWFHDEVYDEVSWASAARNALIKV